MKLESKCNICRGKFVKGFVTVQQQGKQDRKIQVLLCTRCGDTKFSTEQHTAGKYKNNI